MSSVKGVIESFRRGLKTQREDQLIIYLPGFAKDAVNDLIGKEVVVRDKYGNTYIGYVKRRHGNGSKVLVEFDKGLPGHVLGGEAEIRM